jgi:hypothetical protein
VNGIKSSPWKYLGKLRLLFKELRGLILLRNCHCEPVPFFYGSKPMLGDEIASSSFWLRQDKFQAQDLLAMTFLKIF